MSVLLNNVTDITNFLIDNKVNVCDNVLDLTMGNGNDTLTLIKKVGNRGKVFAFDIQKKAIENTKALLIENDLYKDNVFLIEDDHSNVLNYVSCDISFAVYNLGYLPCGDKNIVTRGDNTIKSIEAVLQILKSEGMICICAYVGHEGGREEYDKILTFCKNLSKKDFNVVDLEHINRRETSPKMILIEKIK